MVRFLEALKELNEELKGSEMFVLDMDNTFMEKGFSTTYGGDIENCIEEGCVITWFADGDFDKGAKITFEVLEEAGEDEAVGANYIRIIDIEKFLL